MNRGFVFSVTYCFCIILGISIDFKCIFGCKGSGVYLWWVTSCGVALGMEVVARRKWPVGFKREEGLNALYLYCFL